MKRSHAPIFWLLFGAGGMLAALIGAVLVFITGIAAPTGWLLPRGMLDYARVMSWASTWPAKGFLFIVISLFLWHSAHRIFHTLHDLGIHAGLAAKLVCYGAAVAGTLAAAVALIGV